MPEPAAHDGRADQTILLMDAAAKAGMADVYRHNFLIELPPEGEIMVTGDLHGHAGNLHRIIELSRLPRYRNRHLVLQELVHEIESEDDVCRSFRLVEMAARLKVTFPNQVHILLGNHEFSELLNLGIGKHGRELNVAFQDGVRAAYGDRTADVIKAYHRFWLSCPIAIHTENRLFISHSTPRIEKADGISLDYLRRVTPEEVFLRKGLTFDLLWGRDYRPESAKAFAAKVDADVLLVGHTACIEGMRVPNPHHIILDCKDLEGKYALLPLDKPMAQKDVLERIHKLYE